MFVIIRNLWAILDQEGRHAALSLIVWAIVGAAVEVMGIGIVLPLLQVLADPQSIESNSTLKSIYEFSGSSSAEHFILLCLAGLAIAFSLKAGLTLMISYRSYRTIYAAAARMSSRMYAMYVRFPYAFHISANSASLQRNIINLPIEVCASVLGPLIIFVSEAIVMSAVITVLFLAQPMITTVAALVLGAVAALYLKCIRSRLLGWGAANVIYARDRIAWANQGMAAIKEIKVGAVENFVAKRFAGVNTRWAETKTMSSTVSDSGRPLLEVVLMGLVLGGCAALIISGYNAADLVSVMGLFGIAALRILPSLNRLTFSLGNIRLNTAALDELSRDVSFSPTEEGAARSSEGDIPFGEEIAFRNISYSYPGADKPSLDNVTFTIRRGEAVAFVGPSGAGKTTVCNILIGLLPPSGGDIVADGRVIDGRSALWRSKIGYIPQDIYLLDDTVRRNIAFGLEDGEIDDRQVWHALELAAISDLVKSWPEQLDVQVGERGVRLSGGQRQRIAIARALYRDTEILVLDEATSALDAATEAEINESVKSLSGKRTVVVIAHRVSTVRDMNTLHYMERGKLVASGSFDRLQSTNAAFRRNVLGDSEEAPIFVGNP